MEFVKLAQAANEICQIAVLNYLVHLRPNLKSRTTVSYCSVCSIAGYLLRATG